MQSRKALGVPLASQPLDQAVLILTTAGGAGFYPWYPSFLWYVCSAEESNKSYGVEHLTRWLSAVVHRADYLSVGYSSSVVPIQADMERVYLASLCFPSTFSDSLMTEMAMSTIE